MNDRSPRFVNRLRIFVPLAVLVLILAGATTAFASGAFESHTSGLDSPRDIVERGAVPESTTTTSLPDAADDKGVDPSSTPTAPGASAPPAPTPAIHDLEPNDVTDDDAVHNDDAVNAGHDVRDVNDDNSGSGSISDNSGPGSTNEDSGHSGSGHSSDG